MALSPDGKLLASASQDGTVVLWDLAARRVVGQPLTGHSGSVTSVAFSPDGRMLASGGEDKTVRLWDVATGQPVGLPFAEHTAAVTSVAFSPDGQTLASGSEDGAILLWDVSLASWQARACTNAGRNLSRAEWAQYLPGQPYHKTCEQWPDGP
jgi:WD40 repeat protein